MVVVVVVAAANHYTLLLLCKCHLLRKLQWVIIAIITIVIESSLFFHVDLEVYIVRTTPLKLMTGFMLPASVALLLLVVVLVLILVLVFVAMLEAM